MLPQSKELDRLIKQSVVITGGMKKEKAALVLYNLVE